MALHFDHAEFAARQTAAGAALRQAGLDGLLMFRQESMYYLTGYDTFGYVYFQCMVLSADGRLALLTRAPDRIQAEMTSTVDDIRIWVDGEGVNPAAQLVPVLDDLGLRGSRLGVEWEAYGLTASNGHRLTAALDGLCRLDDASLLVSRLRLVKSEAELVCARRAAALADAGLAAAAAETRPGAFEGDILAALQGAIYRGGGDDPANEQIIGSGDNALLCRYATGRRHLDDDDHLTLEFAGVYRHYHAALMRTWKIGTPSPAMIDAHKAVVDSLAAARDALTPGAPIGAVFDAHAAVLDAAGYREARLNACGYSMGTTFAPNWMDWPMFYHGNPVVAAPGMTFFIHIILFDRSAGLAMTTGHSVEVTETGAVPLSTAPLDLTPPTA